jgi:predicted Zn-dependent protease
MTRRALVHWSIGAAALALAALATWWSFCHAQYRYHFQAARRALTAHDTDLARVHVHQCLALQDQPEGRLLAAQAARLAGDYEAAEAHLRVCEATADVPVEVQRERALLQIQQGDFRGPIDYLQSTATSPEPPADVLEAMAHGLEATLFFDQAAVCLQRLFEKDPEHPRAHVLAGDIFLRKRHAEPALHEFQTAVEQLPDAFRPRLRLAECLLELGQVRQAAAHLEALRDRYANRPELMLAEARVAVYCARPQEARDILQRLLAAHPNHLDALVTLGQLEFHQGEPRDGLPPLQHAVALYPDKPEAWEGLAHCRAALGNSAEEQRCLAEFDRASRALGEVTRLIVRVMQEQPDDVKLRIEVAERYERLHESAKAIQWRFCVLHLDPDHAPSHRALARLFEQTGQPHRAARHRRLAEKQGR